MRKQVNFFSAVFLTAVGSYLVEVGSLLRIITAAGPNAGFDEDEITSLGVGFAGALIAGLFWVRVTI